MNDAKAFTVEIEVVDHPDHTEARAVLDRAGEITGGWGRARRNPDDPDRPSLGEELAMARALSDLAHHLRDDVEDQIEAADGTVAHVHL